MINISEVAENILDIVKKNNCAAQVTIFETESKEMCVREGKVERLLSSLALSTGVRLFKGNKSAIISFSGDNFDHMEAKIKTLLDTVDYLGEDDAKRLLNENEFGGKAKELDLDDRGFNGIETGKIAEILKSIEAAGMTVSDKIVPSEFAEFSGARSRVHLFSTQGLSRSYSKSSYSFSYSAVAASEEMKEVDYWYEYKRYFQDLFSDPGLIANIGKQAAERALKRLGGKKVASGERPVVFANRSAGSLLKLLCYALNGEDILLRNSFLVDKLGETLFNDKITVFDDPHVHRYPGSYPFDGEGMNGKTKVVIDKGKVLTYLHNSYSAGKLNMALTGNASRTISHAPGITCGNFYLQPGEGNQEDLLREMKDGILVEDLFLSGMNDVTGDFSFGCSGFLVEKGKTTLPVKEITIAGNIIDVYKNILQIADDNLYKTSISSPSILVSKLAVAGT